MMPSLGKQTAFSIADFFRAEASSFLPRMIGGDVVHQPRGELRDTLTQGLAIEAYGEDEECLEQNDPRRDREISVT